MDTNVKPPFRCSALRLILTAALAAICASPFLGGGSAQAAAERQSAAGLIDAVNAFRAANGMAPLRVDPILMLVAQEQSDYNASTGDLSHYGPSGRLTRDDAMAAGYGGGSTVFVSENIAVGSGLSSEAAVEMWTGDEPHLNTMLGQYYRDVGAGVGEDDGDIYFTLVTGYVAGGLSANSTVPAAVQAAPVRQPLITVTPQPDGSIIHIVAEGQTLWTIAAIYGLDLAQLLSLNGLTEDSFVVPGQEIVVRAAPTTTPTTAPSPTSTPSPGPPTVSPPTATPAPLGASLLATAAEVNPRDLLAGGCVAAWLIIVIAGLVVAVRRP
jgi:uncharacterized protein YkwD/LysM repeat protein